MKLQHATARKLISAGILLLLMIFFTLNSDVFLSVRNINTILREASVLGIVAVGMTFVIITGGIDLSVGSIMSVVAMTCINLIRFTGIPVILIILIGILIGTACGAINGLIISRLNVPDFIGSLATQGIFRGLTLMIAVKQGGLIVSTGIRNPFYLSLGDQGLFGIFWATWALMFVGILGHVILRKTKIGIYSYAIGSNRKSAMLSGISFDRVKLFVYSFSGLCCAFGGIFTSARLRTATVELGKGFETDVIAAVVVGGTSMLGGRGDIVGSLIGALFIAVLDNGIRKFNIHAAYMTMMRGVIILVFVLFDAWYQRRYERKLLSVAKQDIGADPVKEVSHE